MDEYEHKHRLEAPSCYGQERFLDEFDISTDEEEALSKFAPAILSTKELQKQLLQVASNLDGISTDGITAKELGEKTNMARETATKHANRLVELKLFTLEKVGSAKTGIKPTYIYRLAPGLTKKVIEAAIRQEQSGLPVLFNTGSFNQSDASSDIAHPERLPTGLNAISSKSKTSVLASLKESCLQLNPMSVAVLRGVSELGEATAAQISQKIDKKPNAFNRYLKRLMELGLIDRRQLPNSITIEYVYFLVPGLTPELINAALPEEQASPSDDTPDIEPTPVDEKAPNLADTHQTMQAKSNPLQHPSTLSAKIDKTLEVVKELTQKVVKLENQLAKVNDLEARFTRLEESLESGGEIDPDELLAILRSKKS
jgi:predicted transcriptional regulator